MNLDTHIYPFVYYKGKVTTFKKSKEFGMSYFGGPGQYIFRGEEFGPRKLHHIATIDSGQIGEHCNDFYARIPLLYGLCFDGCEIKYKNVLTDRIEVLHIDPKESNSKWPYENYPEYLPYYPLCTDQIAEISKEDFLERVCQSVWELPDEVMVIVIPPNPELGMSMWGPEGDAEEVELVFCLNTETGEIQSNVGCS